MMPKAPPVPSIPAPAQQKAVNPLNASDPPALRARILLRAAFQGVNMPFEVFDTAVQRATAVLTQYSNIDEEAYFQHTANAAAREEKAKGKKLPNGAN
jgi:hypothetical protein